MARRLGAHDRTAGDAVVADLVARLDGATSTVDMCRFLEALGNTGSPAATDAVAARLRAPSFEVRATAAGALRLIPGDEVQSLLTQTLAADAHVLVRVRAAFALGFRPLDVSLAALERALKQDKDPAVRMEVVGVLGNASRSGGPARQLIEWTAAHDADARIRRAAQQYL
jgi:HEAT repeat protein